MRLLKNYNKLILIILLTCSVSVMAADKAKRINEQINRSINKIRSVEQQKEAEAEKHVSKAKDFFISSKYKQAIDEYLLAARILKTIGVGKKDIFKDKVKYCEEQVYQCYYYWAMDVIAKVEKKSFSKDYAEAIRLCRKASEIYPPCKKKMDDKIKKFTILKDAAGRRYETSESKLIPSKKEDAYDIQVLLKQADALIKAGRYNLAKEKYEQILLSDIYNYKAIEGLRKVNTIINKMGTRRLYTQDKERIAEVSWKNTTPIIPEVKKDRRQVVDRPVKKYSPVSKIRQKLKSIIIPRLDFEDITVETAVRHLREQSKQLDPEGVGINIFLRLEVPKVKDSALDRGTETAGEGGEEVAVAADEEEDEEDEEDDEEESDEEEGGGGAGKKVVDLVLVKNNLYQAIYFLCKTADLKFRIEKYAVVIAAKNVALDDLETKIFPVEQGALAAVGGDDTASLKEYFRDRGIKFPSGAKIVYDSRISRLIATNTLDNLNRLESIIQNELSSKDPMVQIQAKFIEIEQNDLKELGFNWGVQNTPTSDNGTFQIGPTESNLSSVSTPQPTLARYGLSSGGFQMNFDVNALNQADSRNLLSSPRITTMNGQEASIRMVREVYFPDDYTEAETTTTSGGDGGSDTYSFISSIPEFSDPKELGIILRVTPDVDIDHRTITMRVNPTVQTFVTWTDYNYTVTKGDLPVEVSIRKPVIAARTIDTKITIYDGETIVLGGILKDTTKTINERVPIIGEIPLIGRMFQSIGTESIKVNLLIFLTCRLVKPDGTAFFPDVRPNGLAKFRRLK
jgi:Bacterial type II and III secretion system protein